ncbi:poly(A) RNA polymerase, mitochondrial-like [Macrobrachium nipponense]|uniref:poly(A) RNA polymerase, mitochondrial-like n=1 Tax=Macrobrachium nipponense TaxID=159736 RepID=UPI0030C8499A
MPGTITLLRRLNRNHYLLRHSFKLYSRFSTGDAFVPFDALVSRRRNEARCSMLVEVAGVKSASDLYQVCSEFGSVKNMFHYKTKTGHGKREMILVEYEDSTSLRDALNNTIYPMHNDSIIPVHSPFLWLAANKTSKNSKNSSLLRDSESSIPLISEEQDKEMELLRHLHLCSDVSEQIQAIYDYQKLTELGWRLRFFTCRQVEIALFGLFPSAAVLPFGSSVNTFGRHNCDLDMILELTDADMHKDNHRLVFQTKKSRAAANPRITMQRHMEVISDVIDNFVPGCSQVRKILGARVPIIKYYQDYTGIECDLSMANRSGFYMSEMLYLYGCMDPRVRPLVFTIRSWAKDRHMTSPFAGRWITNFSLTLLVLFYLMRTSPPVIPPLQTLIKLAGSSDKRETNGISCTFLRDLRTLTSSDNKDTLETLLKGFFEFYDKFDFKERGLSVVSGSDFIKPEHKALYIQNPLERDLNVSRNVTFEELERLTTEITNARYLLEGLEPVDQAKHEPWGILRLCNSNTHPVALKAGNIAIDWKDFFSPEPERASSADIADDVPLSSRNTSPEQNTASTKKGVKIHEDDHRSSKEQLIKSSDLNGLVTKLKVKVGNTRKPTKNKGHRSGKITYKW